MGRPSNRASEMQRMVDEFRASGLTRRAFCSQRGIAVTTFDYWRRRLRSTPRWVKVELAGAEAQPGSFTLRLSNGRSIESAWRFDEEELARLIRIAERA